MGEALESLVRRLEPRVQLSATDETGLTIVLGDEASEHAVEILQRFNQTEGVAMLAVDGDVLETRSQARRGQEPVAVAVLEREIDARDVIQVVEDHQRCAVVQQRDAAGLQPVALLPAW